MTPAEALASAIMEASDHCDIPNSQGLVTPVETARILAALAAAGWVVVPVAATRGMQNAGAFYLIAGAGGATEIEMKQAREIWRMMVKRAADEAAMAAEFNALSARPR